MANMMNKIIYMAMLVEILLFFAFFAAWILYDIICDLRTEWVYHQRRRRMRR